MTPSHFRAAALAVGAWLLAAPLAWADCSAPDRDCSAEWPPECLQRMGAGAIAADDSAMSVMCEERNKAYLACLDRMIESCEPAPTASSGACSEERETALWREARDAGSKEDLEFFLEVCPESVFRRYAESRLAALETDEAVDAAAGDVAAAADQASDASEAEPAQEDAKGLLASLQSRREEVAASLEKHRADSAALTKAQVALEASLALAKQNLKRMKALASNGIVSNAALDAAKAKWAEFSERNEALVKQVGAQRSLLDRARAELQQIDSDIASAKKKTGG